MIASIKAELRKVFTVRSTYIILLLALALMIFFGFYISGWHLDTIDLHDPNRISILIRTSINALAVFPGLIAILLLTHEYRYNTIMHTLTLSNSRSRVLLAKLIVASVIAIIFSAIVGVLSPLLSIWGIDVHHLKLVHQTIDYGSLVWKVLFYGWGYTMAALLIAVLIRNQIGTIITLFVAPGTVESLLSLLLKRNTVYLPFSALRTVSGVGMDSFRNAITPFHAVLVFGSYLLVGWIIGWILFLKRDAS